MRNEAIFSAGGFYSFIVQSNAITHHEAMAAGKNEVDKWIECRGSDSPVKVLDLACGGEPITIANIMGSLPHVRFHYVGVDINKDQVTQAKNFKYPDNVDVMNIIEGNAWNIDALKLAAPFHLVFSGLNFHHGTPDELRFIVRRIHRLMHADGLLLSHDFYRPEYLPYLRRPDASPSGENMRLIETERLLQDGIISHPIDSTMLTVANDWRADFTALEGQHLKSLGADDQAIRSNSTHVMERDYPVSASEMADILAQEGWRVIIHRFDDSNHLLKEYFSIITGRPLN